MAWTTTDDLGSFLDAAGGFLRSRPVQHTVLLSEMPDEAAAELAAYEELAGVPVEGVNGERPAAEACAAARRHRTGEAARAGSAWSTRRRPCAGAATRVP